jgi:hypothetical protein
MNNITQSHFLNSIKTFNHQTTIGGFLLTNINMVNKGESKTLGEVNMDLDRDQHILCCDICGEDIYDWDNAHEEDGMIYCKGCWDKVLEKEGINEG